MIFLNIFVTIIILFKFWLENEVVKTLKTHATIKLFVFECANLFNWLAMIIIILSLIAGFVNLVSNIDAHKTHWDY